MARKKTDSEFTKEVEDLVGSSYIFLSPYQGAYTKISYYHVDCGEIHYTNPHNFLSGKRCPNCNRGHKFKKGERKGFHTGTPKKTNEEYIAQLYNSHHGNIILLEPYINANTKLHFYCTICHNRLFNYPNDMLRSNCKYCVAREKVKNRKENYRMPSPEWSNGEKLIALYLFHNHISYQYSVMFNGLRDINNLTYDFYIPSRNLLIEYQGIQHYKPCTWGKRYSKETALLRYKKQLKHDEIKVNYAKEHGFTLIHVNYRVKSIDALSKILDPIFNAQAINK